MALSNFFLLLVYMLALCFVSLKCDSQTRNSACQLNAIKTYDEYEYIQEGDIMIGAVLTVNSLVDPFKFPNDAYDSMLCTNIVPHYYRHFVDFLFAIEEINNNKADLYNLTLGYHLYDSCGDPRKAVKSVFQILSGTREPVPNYSCLGKGKIAGFIGDLTSDTTIPIAQILSQYGYPQISYGATDPMLSDRITFPYFFRMVQSAYGHYLVLSKILIYFKWTWVGIIRSDDVSGEKIHHLLEKYLSSDRICIEFTIKIGNYFGGTLKDGSTYSTKPFEHIIQKSSSSVIILCGTVSVNIIGALSNITDLFDGKTLIVSTTVASNSHIMENGIEIFNGSLGFAQLAIYSLHNPKIIHFFESFHPLKYPEDKLLEDIWMLYYFCASKDQRKNEYRQHVYKFKLQNCTGQERITDVLAFDSLLHFPRVYQAVLIMSHALHNVLISNAENVLEKNKKVFRGKVNFLPDYVKAILTVGNTITKMS